MPLARLPWAWVWALISPGWRSLPRASTTVASAGAASPGAPISVMVSPVIRRAAASARWARASRTRPPRTIVATEPPGRSATSFRVPDRAPDALGRHRHVEVAYAERRQLVVDRVQQAGQRAHRAGLPHPLGAEGIHLCRHLVRVDVEEGHVVGARHHVIHEGPREQLRRRRVVGELLEQALAEALDHAAVDLPLHEHGVHHAPDVVDDGVAHDTHAPGLLVDLDLADLRPVGKRDGGRRAPRPPAL